MPLFTPARALVPLMPLMAAIACEPEVVSQTGSAPRTSSLALSADGDTLYVALADHDRVQAVDANTFAPLGEVEVAGTPHRLTVLADGRVAVTARAAGTVSIVDFNDETEVVRTLVGADPHGVVEHDGALWVALAGEQQLARVDLADPSRVAARVVLDHDDPRGLAVLDNGNLAVSHFTAGHLSIVDPEREVVLTSIDLRMPSRPFFFPNQVDQLTTSPGGDVVGVPHVECNNDPAQFGAGGGGFVGVSQLYYAEGPLGLPAVVPAVGRVDASVGLLLSDDDQSIEELTGLAPERSGAVSPLINPMNRPLLGERLVNGPVAVAFAADGALELIVNRGSGNVVVRRVALDEGERSILAVVDVGVGADSIQIAPNGTTAYVFNSFSSTLSAFTIPVPVDLSDTTRFGENAARPFALGGVPIQDVPLLREARVASPALSAAAERGRVLFHAVDNRLTRFGAISCASCHPGGADDGTTWAFAEGPRQSPALWGGISGTEPFHWDQAVRDIADISRVTIEGRMGGTGLSAADMSNIGAFLDTLPVPMLPITADAGSIERGRAIFESDATECISCHRGEAGTDNLAHEVGTGPGDVPRETNANFATPVLRGIVYTSPYLHDGSAQTLREVIDRLVVTDRMGKGSHLSEAEIEDLIAYLRSL